VQSVAARRICALRAAVPGHSARADGGVTLDNIAELFQAGAAAVGVGTELIQGRVGSP